MTKYFFAISGIRNLVGLRGIFFPHQRWRLECSRGSTQAAGNSPDPSLSPPL